MTDGADLEKLELPDVLDIEMVQSLMNDLYELVGISMSIVDLKGKVLVGVGWRDVCARFHRVNPETSKNCIESDTQLPAGIPPGGYNLYKCKNNLWHVAAPLMLGGRHVGNLFSGQFLFEDEVLDRELFRAQAKRYGFNEAEYLAALDAVPRFRRESVDRCMAFLAKQAHVLSEMGYSNLKLAGSLAERKQSQEALSKIEKLLRRLIDAQMIGVFLSDQSGRVEFANDAFIEMLGYSREELEQGLVDASRFVHPDCRERREAAISRLLATGSCPPFECVMLRKDGAKVPVLVGIAQPDEEGKKVAWVLDISRQKELENQLLQTQKMEAVGKLAGGIAHDFNNLLMIISSHAELLLATMPEEQQVSKTASTILAASERGCQLTGKLLAFSRKQEVSITSFDINELLAETAELVRHLLSGSINFQVRPSAAPCWGQADRAMMEQVMVNLVINARDAMPQGGRLVVRASEIVVRAEDLGLHSAVPVGRYGLITVADTGHGISEHIQNRIFEPFFTTKAKERGTGLGLTMVYGIVTQSGGHVRVKSKVNAGTTISIYLPAAEISSIQERDEELGLTVANKEPCMVDGTVLVVDDEGPVRSSVRAFLEDKGLRVADTGDAREAIQIGEQLGEKLSTLITDVMMPEVTGPELARRLLAIRPDLALVFMSGYEAGVIRQEEFPFAKFLEKPFTGAMLLGSVCGRCKDTSLMA